MYVEKPILIYIKSKKLRCLYLYKLIEYYICRLLIGEFKGAYGRKKYSIKRSANTNSDRCEKTNPF